MTVTRRTILTALLGVGGLAAAPGILRPARAADGPLVVNTYGGRWETFWRNQLDPKLETSLGRPIKLDIGLGNGWVSAFRAAGKASPPFSSLMTNERYAVLLRNDGFFEPLPTAKLTNLADVHPVARYPGDVAITGLISPFGIAYRKDLIKTPPKAWKDLWRPEYKGQLGFYGIDNSATPMMIMLAGKLFGSGYEDVDTGIKKIAELKPFPQLAFSGQISPLLSQGQVAIAPIDFAEGFALQKKGVPIGLVAPEDGVLMYDQSFNIAANGADKEASARYIDFMLSPEVQLMLVKEFYVSPVNTKVKVPDDLLEAIPVSGDSLKNIVRFDWDFIAKNREIIADKWAKAI